MRCIDLPGYNLVLNKPESMTDEDCFGITAYRGVMETLDPKGMQAIVPYILTAWQPNKEDLEALMAGRPVMIRTLGQHFQPMAVFTIDDEGKPNY